MASRPPSHQGRVTSILSMLGWLARHRSAANCSKSVSRSLKCWQMQLIRGSSAGSGSWSSRLLVMTVGGA
jgi:hypothetical protein